MFLTSQYINTGKQAQTAYSTPCPAISLSENNRQLASLSLDQVGSPSGPCDLPGNGNIRCQWEGNSNADILVQNHVTMKNARKQIGEVAAKEVPQVNPGPIVPHNLKDFPLFENQLFYEKPLSRSPESPETESLRSWLKTSSPKHKASPALVERIKRITRDENA
ncbi:MAG: hypothetical protein Q8K92_02765 [Leadbetterella sp.]|nr:hypothetical protein [Leadbetterella sp.]